MKWNALALTCMALTMIGTRAGAEAGAPPPGDGPRVVVLGTAQDGGMPQTACACDRCARARRDPALARRVASLAIDLPRTGRTYTCSRSSPLGDRSSRAARSSADRSAGNSGGHRS